MLRPKKQQHASYGKPMTLRFKAESYPSIPQINHSEKHNKQTIILDTMYVCYTFQDVLAGKTITL